MTEFRRVELSTGVTLNVALAGAVDAPAVILLHGFPESHRAWHKAIGSNAGEAKVLEAEKQQYLAEWAQSGALTAMLNWYRAAKAVVPPPGVTAPIPDWLLGVFPKVAIPTLVIWGMRDPALLPIQLEGLDRLVDDLRVVRLPEAGHFAPWEAPDEVAEALEDFLA